MTNPALALAEKYFDVSHGELLIGGVAASKLASKYGTPLFVYSRRVLDRKLDALRGALPPRFKVFYSVKANPNLAILEHFVARGCGLEVASAGEFQLALQAGCEPHNILFAGPGKTEAELAHVLSLGIGEIHLESLTEIKRICEINRRLNLRANVAIRLNPASSAEGGAMRMGGRSTPFGVDEENLDEFVDAVLAEASLDFRGIHLFAGTQILDASILLGQFRHAIEIARSLSKRLGRPLNTLDFGGGLGIPYFMHEKELDLEQLHTGLATFFLEIEADPAFAGTQFVVEPGRFLVGEAGIYLARVIDIKFSRGKKFLVLDGGMNHHLAASGNLGQTIKRNYPVALVSKLDRRGVEDVDVVGPLCTPLDTVARNTKLPCAEIGDLFGIFQSCAYGRSASPLGFLSHPAPPEVLVDVDRHELIQERGKTSNATTLPWSGATGT